MLIIDCHGHYTTAPAGLQGFRDAQLAHLKDPAKPLPDGLDISDDEISASIEGNQLKLLQTRGADLTIDIQSRADDRRIANPAREFERQTAGRACAGEMAGGINRQDSQRVMPGGFAIG